MLRRSLPDRRADERLMPERYRRFDHLRFWMGTMLVVLLGMVAGAGSAQDRTNSPFRERSRSRPDSTGGETVGIGLVLSNPATADRLNRAVRRGAALAVAHANRNGGFRGRRFELLVRTLGKPWTSGTEKIVDLAFRPNVWGLVGGLTGRSAHLIEQVVTKRRMVVLTPWATRASLADIRLPWFFRLVPEDRAQAWALAETLTSQGSIPRVSTIRGRGADLRAAEETFVEVLSERDITPRSRHRVEPDSDLRSPFRRILESDARHVAVFLSRERVVEFARLLPSASDPLHLLVPLAQAPQDLACEVIDAGHAVTMVVPDTTDHDPAKSFIRRYSRRFDSGPPPAAIYSFDAVRTLIAAIRQAGLDRVQIQKALAELRFEDGVTGPVVFGTDGNRRGHVSVQSIRPRSSRLPASSSRSRPEFPACSDFPSR